VTPRSLPVRALVALVAVVLALSACSTSSPAATIGDEELTHEELRSEIAMFRFLTGLSGAPCGSPVEGESQNAACARFTLSNVIQQELVFGADEAGGLSADPAEVRDAIARLEQDLGGAAELDARLGAEGLTRQELEALARRLFLVAEIQQVVIEGGLDEAELREAYEQQLGQFTTVEVSHILVETEEEAAEIAGRATVDNFAKLARDRSIDEASGRDGGRLGVYSEAQFLQRFDPDFTAAALALEPGTISGPVQTRFGWHVIELVRRDVAAFEDVREQLVAQQGAGVFDAWLRDRYTQVDVEVNPRYGRLDPATGEVVPVRSTAETPAPTGATR